GAFCDLRTIIPTNEGHTYGETNPLNPFSETSGRFIVEISPENRDQFLSLLGNVIPKEIGLVREVDYVRIGPIGNRAFYMVLDDLEKAWRGEITHIHAEPTFNEPITRTRNQRQRPPTARTTLPRALILHANGSNRDREAALACELAGAEAE